MPFDWLKIEINYKCVLENMFLIKLGHTYFLDILIKEMKPEENI